MSDMNIIHKKNDEKQKSLNEQKRIGNDQKKKQ